MSNLEMTRPRRWLLVAGMGSVLAGLFVGVAIGAFANPRMGLAAHLGGVQNGMLLLAVCGIWRWLSCAGRAESLLAIAMIVGLWGIFESLIAAAMLGTSAATPIAGAGFSAGPAAELAVSAVLVGSSTLTLAVFCVATWYAVRARS